MTLPAFLMLVALAGLVAACWVQVAPPGDDPALAAHRRRRAALAFALLLLVLSAVHLIATGRLLQRLFAPPADGRWAVIAIDDRPLEPGAYRLSISEGRVSGGRDDCNDWGFDENSAQAGGERMIVTTAVECPEDDEVRRAYWAMATAPDLKLDLGEDGVLRLSARRHSARLRRCEWEEISRRSGGLKRCLPVS